MQGRLVRCKAALLYGVAVPGCDHSRYQEPQPSVMELQRLRVMQGDGAILASGKISEVEGVAAVAIGFQHDGGVASVAVPQGIGGPWLAGSS